MALRLTAVMITALRTAVWNEMLLAVAALALTDTGPGAASLDSALGIERSGPGWMLAALGAGAAGSAMAISRGRRQAAAPPPATPAGAPATPEAPPAPAARTS